MSSPARYLTHGDRRYRHEKIVAAYAAGACSRTVAERFSMSDGHVRSIVRAAGAARRPGQPRLSGQKDGVA